MEFTNQAEMKRIETEPFLQIFSKLSRLKEEKLSLKEEKLRLKGEKLRLQKDGTRLQEEESRLQEEELRLQKEELRLHAQESTLLRAKARRSPASASTFLPHSRRSRELGDLKRSLPRSLSRSSDQRFARTVVQGRLVTGVQGRVVGVVIEGDNKPASTLPVHSDNILDIDCSKQELLDIEWSQQDLSVARPPGGRLPVPGNPEG